MTAGTGTPPSLRPAKNDRIVVETSRLDLPRIDSGWKVGSARSALWMFSMVSLRHSGRERRFA